MTDESVSRSRRGLWLALACVVVVAVGAVLGWRSVVPAQVRDVDSRLQPILTEVEHLRRGLRGRMRIMELSPATEPDAPCRDRRRGA